MKKALFIYFTVLLQCFSFGQNDEKSPIDQRCTTCLDTALSSTNSMVNCYLEAKISWEKLVQTNLKKLSLVMDSSQYLALTNSQLNWEKFIESEIYLQRSIYYQSKSGKEKQIDAMATISEQYRSRALELERYCEELNNQDR